MSMVDLWLRSYTVTQGRLKKRGSEALQCDLGEDFANYAQDRDATVIVTVAAVTLASV